MSGLNWTSLAKTDTGHVFCSSNPSIFDRWEWIKDVVAGEFQCSPNELDLADEADDGRVFVTLYGAPIVEVISGYVRNAAPIRFAEDAS